MTTDYAKAFELLKNVSKRAEDVRKCELQLVMAKELLMKHLQDEATAMVTPAPVATPAPVPTPVPPPTFFGLSAPPMPPAPVAPVSLEPPSVEEAPGYEATNDALEALTESMNPVDPVTFAAIAEAKRQKVRFAGAGRPQRLRGGTGKGAGFREAWYASGGYCGYANALGIGNIQPAGEDSPNGQRGVWLTREEVLSVRELSEDRNKRTPTRLARKQKQAAKLTESLSALNTENRFCDDVEPAEEEAAEKVGTRERYNIKTNPRPARQRSKGEWEVWYRSAQYRCAAKKIDVGEHNMLKENGVYNAGVWLTSDEHDIVREWVSEHRSPQQVIQLPQPQHNQ